VGPLIERPHETDAGLNSHYMARPCYLLRSCH
jgi:hypothetical protein